MQNSIHGLTSGEIRQKYSGVVNKQAEELLQVLERWEEVQKIAFLLAVPPAGHA